MKRSYLKSLRALSISAMILAVSFALAAPPTAMAQRFQGRQGYSSGSRGYSGGRPGYSSGGRQGYSAGRGFSGGGQRYYSPAPAFRGGRSYGGGYYSGGDRGRYFRGNSRYYGYYSAPYAYGYTYAPEYCEPAGYYDNWGRWIPLPGCAVVPYGY